MTLEKIVEKMRKKPYIIGMGAGLLSKRFDCQKEDIYEARRIVRKEKEEKNISPKILILDIETAPLKAYMWGIWNQNIYMDQLISDWYMLSWSAKWLFEQEIVSDVLTSKEAIDEDDKRICRGLWILLDEADIIIAHNSKKFDIPKVKTRFIINGLQPTSPYRQIDTLQIAKREFAFTSNKLDSLAKFFGFEPKLTTGMDLWVRALKGDTTALKYMQKYNKYDVSLLEDIYLKVRPYISNHPNIGIYFESEIPVCPNCGSINMSKTEKFYYTQASKFAMHVCEDCGRYGRERYNSFDKNNRKNLLIGTAN